MPGKTEDLATTLETLRGDYRTLVERLEANQREFQRLGRAVFRVEEEERRRLARELHDGLGQNLTALKHRLSLLASQLGDTRPDLRPDIDASLADQARANLQKAGVTNVTVRQADGSQGAPADGPFDVIMLSGSVAEVPQVLLNQLSIGGRLLAVVGEDPMMRASVITRTAEQQWQTSEPWDTIAPRLKGFPEHNRFAF